MNVSFMNFIVIAICRYMRSSMQCAMLPVVTALSVVGCVTQQETMDMAIRVESSIVAVATPGVTIPQKASFAWLPAAVNVYKDQRLDSDSIQYQIEHDITRNLNRRGYSFIDVVTQADYTIAYTAALESALSDDELLHRFGMSPGSMRIPVGDGVYEKGSLVIYVFDNRDNDMVWRTAAQTAVDFDIQIDERKARIESLVDNMFLSFPSREPDGTK